MLDRTEEKPKQLLPGQVTKTKSSDAYLRKDIEERQKEYYAVTGKVITGQIEPSEKDILKPGSITPVASTPMAVKEADNTAIIEFPTRSYSGFDPSLRESPVSLDGFRARLSRIVRQKMHGREKLKEAA